MSENNYKRRQKRKNNNSRFLSNAKGFGKKGSCGRGTHVEEDQYAYFLNILVAMKDRFDNVEDKVNMANNVFEQTAEQEIHLASNQLVSKVLEDLIGFIDANHLERYIQTFSENVRPICSDRFASHVLQKMIGIAFLRAVGKDSLKIENGEETGPSPAKRTKVESVLSEEQYNLETEFSREHRENCSNFVLRISKFMLNNLEDFVWDSCATHILRTCILSLAGVYIPKVSFAKCLTEKQLFEVPEEWLEIMKEYPERLKMWPQFADFPYQEVTSALMSVICIALKFVDKKMFKSFSKKLLMEALLKENEVDNKNDDLKDEDEKQAYDDIQNTENKGLETSEINKLPKAFHLPCSIVLVETLITLAGSKLLIQLYAMLFSGHLKILARERLTNFAVQKLLLHTEKEDFENIFDELVDQVEELLKIGNTGVVEALSAACLRLCTKQAQFIVALQTALHVAGDKNKSKELFLCLVKLKPYEIMLEDKSTFVHLHGSLIIQRILKFNKPIFLVNCILEIPSHQLITIFNTANGSHIVDAFLQSKYIGAKSREKFIQHLQHFYVDLAVNKFGSRVVEQCFAVATDVQKQHIMKELSDKLNMLKGSPFGAVIVNKLRIETYCLSASQWKAAMEQKQKPSANELFKDIIN